jgi:hypothetical protein
MNCQRKLFRRQIVENKYKHSFLYQISLKQNCSDNLVTTGATSDVSVHIVFHLSSL